MKIKKIKYFIVLVLFVIFLQSVNAQELEPRSLTNVPVGLNFVFFGYGYANGNTLLDSALPLEDLNSDLHTIFAAYVRAIDFFGMSAKVDVIVPSAAGNWDGIYEGEQTDVKRDGFGDPRIVYHSIFWGRLLMGDHLIPRRQENGRGCCLQIITPFGENFTDKLINLGSNRWTFRSQVGIAHSIGNWILEGYGGLWIFTPNNNFWGGLRLEQRPLFTLKITPDLFSSPEWKLDCARCRLWHWWPSSVDDIERDTHISTLRLGLVYNSRRQRSYN